MTTFTSSSTATFTLTHARHLASKFAADMNVCRRYYGEPTQNRVDDYNRELTELLRHGYIDQYEFGFKKAGMRALSWRYSVDASGNLDGDDRAGKLLPSADIDGCDYFNTIWVRQVAGPHGRAAGKVRGRRPDHPVPCRSTE